MLEKAAIHKARLSIRRWELQPIRRRRSSRDKALAPSSAIAMSPTNIQKSVRASCIAAQNPCLSSIGTLVVAIATTMSMNNGIVARIVKRPTIRSVPRRARREREASECLPKGRPSPQGCERAGCPKRGGVENLAATSVWRTPSGFCSLIGNDHFSEKVNERRKR